MLARICFSMGYSTVFKEINQQPIVTKILTWICFSMVIYSTQPHLKK